MKIHWIQHVPFEGLGCIETWAVRNGHDLECVRQWAGDSLPPVEEIAFLVVMGGPMGVHDVAEFPWLETETAFVAEAIAGDAPVLGICLGAQVIAHSLGAAVTRNAEKEIGWFPVTLTGDAAASGLFSSVARDFNAFHWHGETFEIPAGAIRLAVSDACANQAFAIDDRVVGLQFHLEVGAQNIAALIENCGDELVDGPWIDSAEAMMSEPARCDAANQIMFEILDRMVGARGGPA